VPDPKSEEMAERLHSVAIKMLRALRREDKASGVSGPRLSALSVLVFGGPTSLTSLAAAEQVSAPTMTRLVQGLVQTGLATREPEPGNRRRVRIAATEEGRRLLEEGRRRRVRTLSDRLARLAESECRAIERAVELLERAIR
jgi:DNA-binding MarR family transcriptional regulator